MLKVSINKNEIIQQLPYIEPGESASMTDRTADGDNLIIFTCNSDDQGALIRRSLAGIHVEFLTKRLINSLDLRIGVDPTLMSPAAI